MCLVEKVWEHCQTGRNRRIRTSDPRLPKTVLYQTELYSDAKTKKYLNFALYASNLQRFAFTEIDLSKNDQNWINCANFLELILCRDDKTLKLDESAVLEQFPTDLSLFCEHGIIVIGLEEIFVRITCSEIAIIKYSGNLYTDNFHFFTLVMNKICISYTESYILADTF